MADTKDTVQFYWDPVCPWCWITARWMADVGQQKAIEIDWRLFSLRKINAGREMPERQQLSHLAGLRALRVAAAVREQYGREAVAKVYTEMGARKHHEQADIGVTAELEAILRVCSLPPALAQAADEEQWDKVIEEDMAQAVAKAGKEVGVPLIVLDGGEGPGFFGPVFSPAPTGQAALALWEAMVTAGRTEGFYEFKRTRTTGPVFGERPTV